MKKRVFLSLMLCIIAVSFAACGDTRQMGSVMEEQTAEMELKTDAETTAETMTSADVETTAETVMSSEVETAEQVSLAEEQLASTDRSLKDLFDQSNNKGKTENEEKQSASKEETKKKESSKKEKESLEEEESTQAEAKETSKKKENKKKDNKELSEDWTDLQFMIDGAIISVPCTYEELNELGWEFHPYYEDCADKELQGESTGVYQLINEVYGEHIILTASVRNTSEDKMSMTDCQIYKLYIATEYKSDELDEAPEIILPGGITLGAESEDITETYGKYDTKSKNSMGGRSYTYSNRELDCEMLLKTSEKYGLCEFTFCQYE